MTSIVVCNGVGTITIDNQRARNALDDATRRALLDALRCAAEDRRCAAIILRGAGGVFCAGGELSSMPTDEKAIRQRLGEMHDIVRLIHAGPKPVVSAVEGVAFGSGFSLATASDYVVASPSARFGCSFGKLGLIADTGLLWTLPRRIGVRAARSVLLENRTVDAEDALRIGIVDELVTPDFVAARAVVWAAGFVESAPLAVKATRELLAFPGGSLDELLDLEIEKQITLLASDDFAEGRAAFFERRTPDFDNVARRTDHLG